MKKLLPTTNLVLALVLAASSTPRESADFASRHREATAALQRQPHLAWNPTAILVRFRADTDESLRAYARSLVGNGALQKYSLVPGLELLDVRMSVDRAIGTLRPFAMYAEPDYVVHEATTPNDPLFGVQWGLNNTGQTVNGDPGTAGADINGPEAWDTFTGDPNFVVAIIDTGTQYTHPDLAANMWVNAGEIPGNGIDDDGNGYIDDVHGWDFFDHDNDPIDGSGHGTHTAGTVGAVGNNGIGVTGVNWHCKLMPLRFLGPSGGFTSDAVLAVQYATQKAVKVSNNSWGGGGFSQSLYDAINASKSVGHIFCAAAGNSGLNIDSSPFYPASYDLDNLISVAATDNDDARASFSNYGATSVDLGAPGVNIASTYPTDGYAYLSGTSMATPHVAGVTALVYALNPTWTYTQVRSRIFATVRPAASMAGVTSTGGILDARAAVGGGTANTPPSVVIGSPADGSSFVAGTPVAFSGSASDAQDGDLSASLVWTSSLQGTIGTGPSFSRSDLVVGTHTITAAVTDSGGLQGSAQVRISITSSGVPPAAPSSPAVANLGGGSVRVTWVDNSGNEDGFEIQREQRVGNHWANTTTAGTTGPNVVSFTDSPGSGRFHYRVRAFNAFGSSAWTAWVQVNVH